MLRKICNYMFILLLVLCVNFCDSGSSSNSSDSSPSGNGGSTGGGTSPGGTVQPLSNNRLYYSFDNYSIYLGIRYIVTGDFNSDGKPDIAGTAGEGSCVAVMINNGNGFDTVYISIGDIGDVPSRLSAADLNGDGYSDLTVILYGKKCVCVLINDKNGSFSAPIYYSVGNIINSIDIADMDNDSVPDIITGSTSPSVVILPGNGDGTFKAAVTRSVSVIPYSIEISDFNNDGFKDFAVTQDNEIGIYLGEGSNVYTPGESVSSENDPCYIKIADFNNDGFSDLIVSYQDSNCLSIYMGNGNGTFAPGINYYGPNDSIVNLYVHDMNGDSTPDIVFPGSLDTLNIWYGEGDGTFDSGGFIFGIGSNICSLAFADINGDSFIDVISNDNNNDKKDVTVATGQGNRFYNAPVVVHASGKEPCCLETADLDKDGNPDLVVTNKNSGTVDVLLGKGNGLFNTPDTYITGDYAGENSILEPTKIAVVDIDGDTWPDLAILNTEDNTLGLLYNNGNGTFGNKTVIETSSCVDMAAGDFNNDGNVDLCLLRTGRCYLLLGDGSGSFSEKSVLSNINSTAKSLKAGYINNDSNLDILIGTDDNLMMLPGNGDATFQSCSILTTITGSSYGFLDIVTGDYDGDTVTDIAVPVECDDTIRVLLCNSDASVKTSTEFDTIARPHYIATADLTGDGTPDLVTDSYELEGIAVLEGDGNGSFNEPDVYNSSGTYVRKITIGDFNNDGNTDIVMVGGNKVLILLHQ